MRLHCDGCITKIKRIVLKIKGKNTKLVKKLEIHKKNRSLELCFNQSQFLKHAWPTVIHTRKKKTWIHKSLELNLVRNVK